MKVNASYSIGDSVLYWFPYSNFKGERFQCTGKVLEVQVQESCCGEVTYLIEDKLGGKYVIHESQITNRISCPNQEKTH